MINAFVDTPTETQLFVTLLHFGATDSAGKAKLLDGYLAEASANGGGPHVWDPNVEMVEALHSHTLGDGKDLSDEARNAFRRVNAIAWELLDNQSLLVDRSAFDSPLGDALVKGCRELLVAIEADESQKIPIWNLMCFVCD